MKLLTIGFLFFFYSSFAQTDSTIHSRDSSWIIHYSTAYNDSVFALLIKKIPKPNRVKFKEFFDAMTDKERSFFYLMSLPVSSKKELIQNIDSNYINIKATIILFKELIPSEMEIRIQFNPPDKQPNTGESIDLSCSRNAKSGDRTLLFQEWNVGISSKELDSILIQINMNKTQLEKLRVALLKAHCISIENSDPVEVGFARSGMGLYSYLIFDRNLKDSEKKHYNNGCEYIYYKDNIVLEFEIGAVGSPCFPYEEPE